jgi:hypothetical protein
MMSWTRGPESMDSGYRPMVIFHHFSLRILILKYFEKPRALYFYRKALLFYFNYILVPKIL